MTLQGSLERQTNKYRESKILSRNFCRKPCWVRESWTVTQQCWRLSEVKFLRIKNFRKDQSQGASHIVCFTSRNPIWFSQWLLEQVSRAEGEKKGTILKYTRAFCSLTKTCQWKKTILPAPKLLWFCESLTYLGEGKYPTPTNSSLPVPPAGREWD